MGSCEKAYLWHINVIIVSFIIDFTNMSTRLAKHLESLLATEACVVVPGLGGFILEMMPARVDLSVHLAYPPQAELHFNEALSHHDGLLEALYAHIYGVSRRRARLLLEEDVRMLRQSLVRHRHHQLGRLGELRLSEEGTISFSQNRLGLVSSIAYGLSSVPLPQQAQATRQVAEHSSGETGAYLHLKLSKRGLAWTSAAAVMALALLPWSRQNYRPTEHFTASFVPSERGVRQLWGDLPETSTVQAVAALEADRSNQEEDLVEPEIGRYYVIIASERDEARARIHYDRARGETLAHLAVLKGSRMYWVSAGDFTSAAEAYRYMQEIRSTHAQAWVYTPSR